MVCRWLKKGILTTPSHPVLFMSWDAETWFSLHCCFSKGHQRLPTNPLAPNLAAPPCSLGLHWASLPLWTVCLRFISYFSDYLFTVTLTEFFSISLFFFKNKGSMRFSVPFSSFSAFFLYLKELIYSHQFHFIPFSTPEWVASSSFSIFNPWFQAPQLMFKIRLILFFIKCCFLIYSCIIQIFFLRDNYLLNTVLCSFGI